MRGADEEGYFVRSDVVVRGSLIYYSPGGTEWFFVSLQMAEKGITA